MLEFLTKYKWQLIGVLCLYVSISLWLFFATDSPQAVPFEYQVR
jgi:hypothetical protein